MRTESPSHHRSPAPGVVVCLVVGLVVGDACTLPLALPEGARVLCARNDDCPGELLCAVQAGLCVTPEGACVVVDAVVDDGAPCARSDGTQGVCIAARCTESVCGDGFVDVAAREECDDGDDNSDTTADACRSDCRAPRCGDNVVDFGEGCDAPFDAEAESSCSLCVVTCPRHTGDCNGDATDGCECAAALIGDERDLPRQYALGPGVAYRNTGGDPDDTTLLRISLQGGAPEILAEHVDHDIAADDVGVYFGKEGAVRRIRHGETTQETFLEDSFATGFLFEPGVVYVVSGDEIVRVDVEGTNAAVVAVDVGSHPALQGDSLVWATPGGEIVASPKGALGTPVVLARGHFNTFAVAADERFVYFVDGSGVLSRLDPTSGLVDAMTRFDASSPRFEQIGDIRVVDGLVTLYATLEGNTGYAPGGLLGVPVGGGVVRLLLQTHDGTAREDRIVSRDGLTCIGDYTYDIDSDGFVYSLACIPL